MVNLRCLKRAANERFTPSSDPSLDALLHLAAALAAMERLGQAGADLQFSGRLLATPFIERAIREVQYARSKRTPEALLDTTRISKFGRLQP